MIDDDDDDDDDDAEKLNQSKHSNRLWSYIYGATRANTLLSPGMCVGCGNV